MLYKPLSQKRKNMKKTLIIIVTVASLMSGTNVWAKDNTKILMNETAKLNRSYNGIMSDDLAKAARETVVNIAVEVVAVPTAVSTVSALGTTAGTGAVISSLSGAAATSATLASIGGSSAVLLGGVGIALAPVVVGGAIVTGVALAVGFGINSLIDCF